MEGPPSLSETSPSTRDECGPPPPKLCPRDYTLHSLPSDTNHCKKLPTVSTLLWPFLCSFLWQNSLKELTSLSLGPRTGFHPHHITKATPEKATEDARDLHVTTSKSPFSGLPRLFLRARDRADGSAWRSFPLGSPATCSWFSPTSPAAPSVFLPTFSLPNLLGYRVPCSPQGLLRPLWPHSVSGKPHPVPGLKKVSGNCWLPVYLSSLSLSEAWESASKGLPDSSSERPHSTHSLLLYHSKG